MKKLAIFILSLHASLFTVYQAGAQGCLPEGITFSSQSEIDSFQVNYPGCTLIEGDVTINGNNITNLAGLITLNSIGGSLTIGIDYGWDANPLLENLIGLENLVSVGDNLIINGNSILVDLSGLNSLTAVSGNLSISNNPLLTEITDLGSLNSIGGSLDLGYGSWLGSPLGNPLLVSLAGLEGITSLAGLTLIGNHTLTDLNGLNNLQSISNGILIGGNEALSSLAGLETLSYLGGSLQFGYAGNMGWQGNPSLFHLTGLEGLTEIGGDLQFNGSDLVTLEGLNNLESIGNDLLFFDNGSIVNLEGLDNLNFIGGKIMLGPYPGTGGGDWSPEGNPALLNFTGVDYLSSIGGDLVISLNSVLVSLSGFENLVSIGGDMIIYANLMLADISDLENIEASSIENLEIHHNDSLSDCKIQAICDYLADPNGTIDIHNNAPGCNSEAEVEAACVVGVEEPDEVQSSKFKVQSFPNPTRGIVDLRFTIDDLRWVSLKIYNAQGQQVATLLDEALPAGEHTISWNAENLPAGIYYYRLTTDNRRLTTGKIVKY